MKINGLDREFLVIGENIHTTRVVLRKGKLVVDAPDGRESVRFYDTGGERRYLPIPEAVKSTQDYEEGRVKHVKIAVQLAMAGEGVDADAAMAYLERMVQRQEDAGADFLDLNVDEISLKLEEQKEAMQWLVETVDGAASTPISVDSSNAEILETGLRSCRADGRRLPGRPMLNSASLERIDALELALGYGAVVMVTAAGAKGMPESSAERVDHASQMIEAALAKGIAAADIYVDPLVFPISVDMEFGNHCLDAIRELRERFGEEIHISGGFSNVSFGLPMRKLINDVFLILAIGAGADSGIVDPVTSGPGEIFAIDRDSGPYRLAEDMLLGKDRNCKSFLRAYRKGELG